MGAQYQTFDFPGLKLTGLSNSPAKWSIVKNMGIDFKGARVLDVGCNDGYFTLRAAEAGAYMATGIDTDKAALDNANRSRDTLQKRRVWAKNAGFLREDVFAGYPELAADIVLCLSLTHHVSIIKLLQVLSTLTKKHLVIEALVVPLLDGYSDTRHLLEYRKHEYIQELLPSPKTLCKMLVDVGFSSVLPVGLLDDRLFVLASKDDAAV